MKKWLLDILKGAVIGVANIIPGVSGGTMMIIMGVYDKLTASTTCSSSLPSASGFCCPM